MTSAGTTSAHAAASDSPRGTERDLLDASRRLDWRFLLPDAGLGAVAYAGPEQAELAESLALFCESVTHLTGPVALVHGHAHVYDLAVLVDPSQRTLRHAVELLREGGALYLEIQQRVGPLGAYMARRARDVLEPRGTAPMGGPAEYAAALGRMGLVDVRRYWHWSSFERCTEIVPLDDPAALLHFLSRHGTSPLARLRAALGRSLVRRGRLANLAPCVSIVALKPPSGA